jgi:hypothetical protein
LKKETLDLVDIIECLGDRPFPLPDSLKDYLDEIKKRKENQQKGETVVVANEEKEGDKDNENEKEVENNSEEKQGDVQVNEKSKMNNN